MRLLKRELFLKEPKGVLFNIYKSTCFEGLKIKHETIENSNNFYYMELIGNIKNNGSEDLYKTIFEAEKGALLELEFDTLDIDDMEDNQIMFAVYDISDIYGLISILNCIYSKTPHTN